IFKEYHAAGLPSASAITKGDTIMRRILVEIRKTKNQVPVATGFLVLGIWFLGFSSAAGPGAARDSKAQAAPEGWSTASPRPEIRPDFSYETKGGRDGKGSLRITADKREGLDGFWTRTYPITGGQYYRFHSVRRVANVPVPRRSAVVRILWRDDSSKAVSADEPTPTEYLKGWVPVAEAEFPTDKEIDKEGWTEVSGVYRAPSKATRAVVELHLQWAPG